MKKITIWFYILLFGLAFYNFNFQKVSAKLPGEGLTISPPIFELTLMPGQSSENIIKMNNPTSSLVEVYPTVMNFQAGSETGDPTFTSASEEGRPYSLANWITFNKAKLALTPEQDIEFKFKISVPTDAEPGGHYGVVFYVSEPPKPSEKETQIAISSMLGSLILVRVPGDIKEEAVLREFSAKKFYWKMPADLVVRIENIGNVHIKPRGDIIVKNMLGSQNAALDVNPKKGNILPESIRRFDVRFEGSKFSLGRYSANLNLQYGESNKTISGKISFWVIPWWLITIIVVLLIVIVWLIVRKIRKNRRNVKTLHKLEPPQKNALFCNK